SQHHAALGRREPAPLAAEVEHRLAGRPGPAPPPLDQLDRPARGAAQQRCALGDPHVARLEVRHALGKADLHPQLAREPEDRVGRLLHPIEVAHRTTLAMRNAYFKCRRNPRRLPCLGGTTTWPTSMTICRVSEGGSPSSSLRSA